MIPNSNLNIYPKTKKNIKALISFYFDKFDLQNEGAVEKILEKTSLSLNQIEFIICKLSESYLEIFKPESINSVSNLFRYGVDGLIKSESEWSFGDYSKGRIIIKKFINFVIESETNRNDSDSR